MYLLLLEQGHGNFTLEEFETKEELIKRIKQGTYTDFRVAVDYEIFNTKHQVLTETQKD